MIILKPLLWLDTFILKEVEHSMHLLQKLTGRTNYYILSRFELLECGLALLILWQSVWQVTPEDLFSISGLVYRFAHQHPIIFSAFFVISLFRGMYGWRTIEDEAFNRVSRGLANPKKISLIYIFTRIFVFWFIVGYWALSISKHRFLIAWPFFTLLVVFLLALYLDCCDPLPPCRGKIGDWLDALNRKPVLVENEK